jgi:hypothetical protein
MIEPAHFIRQAHTPLEGHRQAPQRRRRRLRFADREGQQREGIARSIGARPFFGQQHPEALRFVQFAQYAISQAASPKYKTMNHTVQRHR